MTRSTRARRSALASAPGSANCSPDSATLRLARLIRWAIVASGTRKAAAISFVDSPPSARSVRATADGRRQRGWQHMKKRTSVSSSPGAASGGSRDHDAARSSRRAAGLVTAVQVRHATRRHPYQPAERVVRHAVVGPGGGGCHEGLLYCVLGVGEVAVAADDDAEGPRGQLAQQTLDAWRLRHTTSGSGALTIWRTSMRWRIGAPPWPGAAEIWAAISRARSGVSTSTTR